MKNDRSQDKYSEIFHEMKEEKMDWDFEDFLKKTEENTESEKVVPLQKAAIKPEISKFFWMAASLVLMVGIIFLTRFLNDEPQIVIPEQNEALAENQATEASVERFDNQELKSETKALKNEAIRTNSSAEIAKYTTEKEVLDQILPKRGRIKKERRAIYVNHSKPDVSSNSETVEYSPDYVIINGKKIYSEAEALEVTKKAIHMFATNIHSTIQEAQPIENLTIDL